MNYQVEIEKLLQPLPRHFAVRYALVVAKDVYPLVREEDKEIVKFCLDTIELWLNGKATAKEVKAAGDNAYAAYAAFFASHAACVAFHAAYATFHAAYAAYAAYTVSHASHAAHAASRAASRAAYATFHAASRPYEKRVKKYHSLLIEMMKDLSETEKLLWGIA